MLVSERAAGAGAREAHRKPCKRRELGNVFPIVVEHAPSSPRPVGSDTGPEVFAQPLAKATHSKSSEIDFDTAHSPVDVRFGSKVDLRCSPVSAVANLPNRDVPPQLPFRTWVTAINRIRTFEGWMFLAAMKA